MGTAADAAAAAALDKELTARETSNAAIHAQALGVMNIKVLIPVMLDKPANNIYITKSQPKAGTR
jgi:precorrin-4 methylase